jgi:hypothetical protein
VLGDDVESVLVDGDAHRRDRGGAEVEAFGACLIESILRRLHPHIHDAHARHQIE